MKDKKNTSEDRMSRSRYAELKQMLDGRRREIQAEVQGKMRDVREEGTWGGKLNEVLDAVESSEADIQEDIEFALIQMKSETLNKINDALCAPRARELRILLRLRRGNRAKAPSCATLRRPLQGLRGSARSLRAAAAAADRPARCQLAVPRHVRFRRPEFSRGSAGGGASPSPPARFLKNFMRPASTGREARSR